MTGPKTRSAAEWMASIEAKLNQVSQLMAEVKATVDELDQALLRPVPGHEKSLLQRMAAVVIAAEAEAAAGNRLVRTGALATAAAALIGLVVMVLKFGKSAP